MVWWQQRLSGKSLQIIHSWRGNVPDSCGNSESKRMCSEAHQRTFSKATLYSFNVLWAINRLFWFPLFSVMRKQKSTALILMQLHRRSLPAIMRDRSTKKSVTPSLRLAVWERLEAIGPELQVANYCCRACWIFLRRWIHVLTRQSFCDSLNTLEITFMVWMEKPWLTGQLIGQYNIACLVLFSVLNICEDQISGGK